MRVSLRVSICFLAASSGKKKRKDASWSARGSTERDARLPSASLRPLLSTLIRRKLTLLLSTLGGILASASERDSGPLEGQSEQRCESRADDLDGRDDLVGIEVLDGSLTGGGEGLDLLDLRKGRERSERKRRGAGRSATRRKDAEDEDDDVGSDRGKEAVEGGGVK